MLTKSHMSQRDVHGDVSSARFKHPSVQLQKKEKEDNKHSNSKDNAATSKGSSEITEA